MDKHELHPLEAHITELMNGLKTLNNGQDLEALLKAMRLPGFTLAEPVLMKSIAQAMSEQVKSLIALKRAFISSVSKTDAEVGSNPPSMPPPFHLA